MRQRKTYKFASVIERFNVVEARISPAEKRSYLSSPANAIFFSMSIKMQAKGVDERNCSINFEYKNN